MKLLLFFLLTLLSPDGRLQLQFDVQDTRLQYRLTSDGEDVVLPSHLGYELKGDQLLTGFRLEDSSTSSFSEDWAPVWGEERLIHNEYNELLVTLRQTVRRADRDEERFLCVRFRLFNEGLAFRYEFPLRGLTYMTVVEEKTEFALPGDETAYWISGDYDTQEYEYTRSRLSEIRHLSEGTRLGNASQRGFSPTGVQTALLLHYRNGLWVTIHEAACVDYSTMHLHLDDEHFVFTSHLTPDGQGVKGHLQAPCHSPWRTVQVAREATAILANRMTLNLNEPCKIEDTSWIRPSKYVGVWWEMITGKKGWSYTGDLPSIKLDSVDYTQVRPHGGHGATTENVKRYIDFAAEYGFDGVLVEGWNTGWEDWLGKEKDYVYDFRTCYPDFDIDEVNRYAHEKGVYMIMHHETSASIRNYERHLHEAYAMMNRYGYPAVKSGYVGPMLQGETHYSQWLNNHYLYCVTEAAKYHIMVNAHEATRPTGLCRTWPNLIGNESAMGTEYQATHGIRPGHTCILPFTRLNGGPMDYTPGIFEMDMQQVNPYNHHHCNTTICNQLSLYVTMYSPLQMAADLPENYLKHLDAFRFIQDVALDWDESWYLEAEPMEYVTIARKVKGKDEYFIGGNNGAAARLSRLSFAFLPAGKKYIATIYRDAAPTDKGMEPADAYHNEQAYVIETRTVNSRSLIHLWEAVGGGYAIRLTPK